jgi:isorenieratene synthase
MNAEYLLFDLAILAGPLALSLLPRAQFARPARSLAWAIVAVAPLFILWDALVVGRHWWFDPRFNLGVTLWGLPVEELAFFVVVPFGCVFAWETLMGGPHAQPGGTDRRVYPVLAMALATLAVAALATGREYTGLALAAAAGAVTLDRALGTALLVTRRAWLFGAVVVGLTLVFNGYLTARPVVHYDAAYQLGWRIATIPIEDFVYGLALTGAVLSVYQWHMGRAPDRSWAARAIVRRLGGYRQRLHAPDPQRPERIEQARRVAVVGGGIAGLSAAAMLAERGFAVTLFERQAHLGGKIGAWSETLPDGRPATVEHGFHAFFGHYYNLDAWLSEIGVDPVLAPIGDYVILTRDGRRLSFGTKRQAPGLNLLDLGRRGLFRFRDVMRRQTGERLRPMLQYDRARTFADFDEMSFETFATQAKLPADLRLVFNSFARAFFSDHDRLSTAELIKSFHFYYLSHDLGLDYRYLRGDYARDLLQPIEAHCEGHGAQLRRGEGVRRIERDGDAFVVRGRRFDEVVMATDVRATREILEQSPAVCAADPKLIEDLQHLPRGQRYSVLRLWLDRASPEDLPVFVATERDRALDAIAFVDRISEGAAAAGHGVVELHCYAVPDDMSDGQVRDAMLDDLRRVLPSLGRARILREHLQVRDDFTAFHVGLHRHRPGWVTAMPGLYLAGDWVALPTPAMLMEAAHTSARLAVNAICDRAGVRTFPIDTVPCRGVLAPPSSLW